MLTLVRNVASSIGITNANAQLNEGARRYHAILNEHITPFNHALQMPDVSRMINMSSDAGRAMADAMLSIQAQILAFSHDYQLVMSFILVSIPLAVIIGSSKTALRAQAAPADHAVIEL